jgi:hypothetical protein
MSRLSALIVASVLMLLLLIYSYTTVVIRAAPNQTPLIHDVFYVWARDFKRYDFETCSGCEISIVFYVYEGATQDASDIIFRALAPDGREVYPRTKISGKLAWTFVAKQGGRYTLEFDNTYSLLTVKRVDLAIAITPSPTTVKVTETVYRTTTTTAYTTTTMTIRETTTIYRTTTAYTTTTITSITTTTITSPGLGLIPEPGLTALIGVVALIIGLVIGMIVRRPKPSTKV